MKFGFKNVLLPIVVLSIFFAACSSNNPEPTQSAPTIAPSQRTQSTSAPNPTQSSNAGGATATSQISAQATSAPTSAPTNTTAATTAASTPAAPNSGSGALDLIANAIRAQFNSKSFRGTSVTTTAAGAVSTMVIEYVNPDRMHVIRTPASGPQTETIAIKGQGTWTKTGGKWVKSPVDLSTVLFAFVDPKNIEQLRNSVDIGTVQLIGPDLIGTTPTLVYQYNESIKGLGAGGTALNATNKVWVGVTDHRVYKLEGDTDSISKPGTKDHIVSNYEYDINIQIQPPI